VAEWDGLLHALAASRRLVGPLLTEAQLAQLIRTHGADTEAALTADPYVRARRAACSRRHRAAAHASSLAHTHIPTDLRAHASPPPPPRPPPPPAPPPPPPPPPLVAGTLCSNSSHRCPFGRSTSSPARIPSSPRTLPTSSVPPQLSTPLCAPRSPTATAPCRSLT
jgi:hypothetical protein